MEHTVYKELRKVMVGLETNFPFFRVPGDLKVCTFHLWFPGNAISVSGNLLPVLPYIFYSVSDLLLRLVKLKLIQQISIYTTVFKF